MRTEIANTVKALRKQYGLTQEEAARKAGVSLAFLRELEQLETHETYRHTHETNSLFSCGGVLIRCGV